MTSFIKGILIANEICGEYQGFVFSRELTLRHSSGREIIIFDPEVLGDDLIVGKTYEVIVTSVVVFNVRLIEKSETIGDEAEWIGVIVDTDYIPPIARQLNKYTTVHGPSNIYTARVPWLLVETPVGNILLSKSFVRRKTGANPEIGSKYIWEKPALHLYAVL